MDNSSTAQASHRLSLRHNLGSGRAWILSSNNLLCKGNYILRFIYNLQFFIESPVLNRTSLNLGQGPFTSQGTIFGQFRAGHRDCVDDQEYAFAFKLRVRPRCSNVN